MAKGNKNAASTSVLESEVPQASEQFVGQWNRLVSTTNWEKGRIICDWREALLGDGAAVTDYSDEAWAQLVGGVTSQHVGRLRRVFQRFGETFEQYPGLYWSHFQAGLDWDDAPMWLEGAIQNDWSVSQMRGKRWETLGTPAAEQRAELENASEFDVVEAVPASAGLEVPTSDAPSAAKTTSVKSIATEEATKQRSDDEDDDASFEDEETATAKPQAKRTPLNVNVELLSDDLADAFEQFKLAIIAQRREGWRDTTRETVIECLDALKDLALAEA